MTIDLTITLTRKSTFILGSTLLNENNKQLTVALALAGPNLFQPLSLFHPQLFYTYFALIDYANHETLTLTLMGGKITLEQFYAWIAMVFGTNEAWVRVELP